MVPTNPSPNPILGAGFVVPGVHECVHDWTYCGYGRMVRRSKTIDQRERPMVDVGPMERLALGVGRAARLLLRAGLARCREDGLVQTACFLAGIDVDRVRRQ